MGRLMDYGGQVVPVCEVNHFAEQDGPEGCTRYVLRPQYTDWGRFRVQL